ncbi:MULTISPECIES: 2,3,4,5-tetrahydropyridine-2,6-dicarboxylate N-succinyltransferase [Prosthecochloris]|uniref:2,3,4,5-tetrahydropyridine-2,6-dicarboxylate N-succinyltransferase n=1 Tax=Prosthecochloris marina TaxID=2017681 RepID=A0A317T3G4_9CHLB|nr:MULTISPECIES: 2,3,4,5-tetrahydropyridine-2,6-dicarboxylate N-succinyltransferase [Prosthecochloris]PWW81309.1 2,3,4,5-tetrahydropyridine-2,6-dicarboxylate N-succinyltransferase [Prosthecochloris marina]UZJ37649.1 2,3,4,5-tetrahydropyridine-2,6-dicarboxylate N-succinyltransferase [Prosthecochloris sp. SCSIO W1103]
MLLEEVRKSIENLAVLTAPDLRKHADARDVFMEFQSLLNEGKARAAEKKDGCWQANSWVKQGILLGMKLGLLQESTIAFPDGRNWTFVDKDTYPVKQFRKEDGVRVVPGGSSVRDGAYLAPSVVMMPPAYVNVGAYVDAGSMIDSHALVGSCAQVGRNVHLSAAVQVGGVLEPVGAVPVVIEDDVMVGGNCGIYEGTIVGSRAVLGTGVILNGSTPVYDIVHDRVIRKTEDAPLSIPEGAVVVAGSRKIKGSFADEHGLSIYTPVIIKYRDEKTDSATALESALR